MQVCFPLKAATEKYCRSVGRDKKKIFFKTLEARSSVPNEHWFAPCEDTLLYLEVATSHCVVLGSLPSLQS